MKIGLRLAAFVFAAALLISFASCNQKNEFTDVEFDIESLASKLYEGCVFDDELVRLSDELTATRYNFGGVKAVAYAGSGATAEVIIIVEYADKETAANSIYLVKNYVKDQITFFEGYNANELPKLHSALCRTYGKYAVLCVSGDTVRAQEIVENY